METTEEKRKQEIIKERLNDYVPYESLFRGAKLEIKKIETENKQLKEEIGKLKSLQDENDYLLEEINNLKEEILDFKSEKRFKQLEERLNGLLEKEENRKEEIQRKNEAILKRKEETITLQKKISKLYVKISQLTALNILQENTIRSRDLRITEQEKSIKEYINKLFLVKEIIDMILVIEDESDKSDYLKQLNSILNESNN